MIRIKSTHQAQGLKGEIPELVIKRMVQFQGDDVGRDIYNPDVHGYLIVIQSGDNLESIPEAGERGLLTFLDKGGRTPFEYIFQVIEKGQRIFEAVLILDDERTIAFFIPETIPIDDRLRRLLETESQLEPGL